MTIDKPHLEASIQNLKRQRQEALELACRCDGAIEVCQQLLKRLETPEPETEPKPE